MNKNHDCNCCCDTCHEPLSTVWEKLLFISTPTFLLILFMFAASIVDAQTLDIVFDAEDKATLEQLVTIAQGNDLNVIEAKQDLRSGEYSSSTAGRVTDSLSVNAGTGLQTDFYGQAAPSLSVSVSLDVMGLFEEQDTTALDARVKAAEESARLRTVEAFVGYKVATESAEAAARALDAAQAGLEVANVRLEAGAEVAASQIASQSAVADSAIGLLTANGTVIVALEKLSSVVGLPAEETAAMLGSETLASATPAHSE